MARAVRLRELAAADIVNAAEYYRIEAEPQLALDFIGEVERSIGKIGRRPLIGSLRFAYELDIPDLRAVPLDRFPYVVFYVVADGDIDVWRVLHQRRELTSLLESPPT